LIFPSFSFALFCCPSFRRHSHPAVAAAAAATVAAAVSCHFTGSAVFLLVAKVTLEAHFSVENNILLLLFKVNLLMDLWIHFLFGQEICNPF